VEALTLLTWNAARAGAFLWRFSTLRLSRTLAARTRSPLVLERRFHGRRLAVDVSRSDTHRLLFLEGERFVLERELLAGMLEPGMHAVDVGANIGYYALIFSAHVGPGGRVTCLEPEPDNLRELEQNVELNGLSYVRVLPFAAGREDTSLRLKRGLNGMVSREGGDEAVMVKRLDGLELGRVDFIKIDVEGFECEVLRGATSLIEEHGPSLFIEVHPDLLPSRTDLRWILEFLSRRYLSVEAHRQAHPVSLLAKATQRYADRGWVESASDARAWVESAIVAQHEAPFWLVARKPRSASS
jgi:FkbM family methyltransferase